MPALLAMIISVGVLAGLATWAYLSIGTILLWAAFLAWACFFHNGATSAALGATIRGNIFGVFAAWIAALIIVLIPLAPLLSLPVWAGLVVSCTVMLVCWASVLSPLSSIPSAFYGYAATFAYLVQTSEVFTATGLTQATIKNPLMLVSLSMVGGALIGYASAKAMEFLARPSSAPTPAQ